jgi:hypothetical protein
MVPTDNGHPPDSFQSSATSVKTEMLELEWSATVGVVCDEVASNIGDH